jgi:Domain of unknown function (DU1801)
MNSIGTGLPTRQIRESLLTANSSVPNKEVRVYEAKTKPTLASFKSYLAGIENEERRKDCKDLAALMKRISGCAPKMWGASIVGFGSYHFKYESGHEGDCPLVGFSSRKNDISVYLASGYEAKTKELLSGLGKYRNGKACLYIRCLADVQRPVLEHLITQSVAEAKRRRRR